MTELETKKIIEEEKLKRVNWFEESKLRENQVGIKKEGNTWIVYVTDERASVVEGSIAHFSSEEEAYEMLIRKGRYAKKRFG